MNGERHVIDAELKALLEDPVKLFLANRESMKQSFPWQGAATHCLCALLRTSRAALLDGGRVHEMRALVRGRTGGFSQFRGLPLLPLSTLLSGSLMPEGDLDDALKLHGMLREAGFPNSPYLAEAAFLPLMIRQEFDAEACVGAAYDMFKMQREARPLLGAETACLYTLLAAMAGETAERSHDETERAYPVLKATFPASGTTYALARVLTLGEGETEQRCACVIELYQKLGESGLRFGRRFELPALGVLSLLPVEPRQMAQGIADMDARLKREKGFSAWSVQASLRILYAASLYALTLAPEQRDIPLCVGLVQSVTGVLSAAQTAACIGASAAAASSAAASSSGG